MDYIHRWFESLTPMVFNTHHRRSCLHIFLSGYTYIISYSDRLLTSGVTIVYNCLLVDITHILECATNIQTASNITSSASIRTDLFGSDSPLWIQCRCSPPFRIQCHHRPSLQIQCRRRPPLWIQCRHHPPLAVCCRHASYTHYHP